LNHITATKHYRRPLIVVIATLVMTGGCSLHKPTSPPLPPPVSIDNEQDGPPKQIKDISNIPNAIPQHEPRARYGNHSPYQVLGKTYSVMESAKGYQEEGVGSWYGEKFAGRKTSSFEPYDPYAMTAAHKSLPLPTYVRVKNLENNKEIIVKVNDRGPFHDDRIIDLSYAAAAKLGYMKKGTARVYVEAINIEADSTMTTPPQSQPVIPLSQPLSQPLQPQSSAQPTMQPSAQQPLAAPPSSTSNETKTTHQQIFLQVAAFSQLSTAQALEKQLSPTIKVPVTINSEGTSEPQLHRVRVGPFANEMSAILVSEQIKIQNMGDPLIIHR